MTGREREREGEGEREEEGVYIGNEDGSIVDAVYKVGIKGI
jgi:hypothetical protein